MGTISLHGISRDLEKILKEKAKEKKQSLSSFIKQIIEKSLEYNDKKSRCIEHIKKFSGLWSEQEFQEFEGAVQDFEKIDPEEWK